MVSRRVNIADGEVFGLDVLQQQKTQGQRDVPAASGVFRAGHALQWDTGRCLLMTYLPVDDAQVLRDCHSNVE